MRSINSEPGVGLTTGFLLCLGIILVCYDAVMIAFYGFTPSISNVIYTYSKDWPIIPFLFGVVMGHFFFPMAPTKEDKNGKRPDSDGGAL